MALPAVMKLEKNAQYEVRILSIKDGQKVVFDHFRWNSICAGGELAPVRRYESDQVAQKYAFKILNGVQPAEAIVVFLYHAGMWPNVNLDERRKRAANLAPKLLSEDKLPDKPIDAHTRIIWGGMKLAHQLFGKQLELEPLASVEFSAKKLNDVALYPAKYPFSSFFAGKFAFWLLADATENNPLTDHIGARRSKGTEMHVIWWAQVTAKGVHVAGPARYFKHLKAGMKYQSKSRMVWQDKISMVS